MAPKKTNANKSDWKSELLAGGTWSESYSGRCSRKCSRRR